MNSPEPKIWSELKSQEQAVARLQAALKSPVHAYLFYGPPASLPVHENGAEIEGDPVFVPVLTLAANTFAGEIFAASDPDQAERHRELAKTGMHPNLVVIEPKGRSYLTEEISEVIREANLTPREGLGKKIMVCTDFQTADEQAAARLLKTLEEPPAGVVIILLVEEPAEPPDTIASRCTEIRFSPLTDLFVSERLAEWGASAEDIPVLTDAAAGDPARAWRLLKNQGFWNRFEFWKSVPARLNGTASAAMETWEDLRQFLEEMDEEAEQNSKTREDASAEANMVKGGATKTEENTTKMEAKKTKEQLNREKRKIRQAELKFGLSVISRHYLKDIQLRNEKELAEQLKAQSRIQSAMENLDSNPNEFLLFSDLFMHLPGPGSSVGRAIHS